MDGSERSDDSLPIKWDGTFSSARNAVTVNDVHPLDPDPGTHLLIRQRFRSYRPFLDRSPSVFSISTYTRWSTRPKPRFLSDTGLTSIESTQINHYDRPDHRIHSVISSSYADWECESSVGGGPHVQQFSQRSSLRSRIGQTGNDALICTDCRILLPSAIGPDDEHVDFRRVGHPEV